MAGKSANGAGSIRKRPDGRWEARYTVGRDPGTGKLITKSVYGKTQKEVRQKLIQATAAIDTGTYFEPSKMTLGNWLDTWLEEYTPNIKPLTRTNYKNNINNNIKPYIGAIPLISITTPDIQKVYNRLLRGDDLPATKSKKTATHLSAKSIKNVHGILHKALQQAVQIGLIKHNPAESCILPQIVKEEIHPLDSEQIAAFLKAISGDPFEYVYIVTLFTGMRQGEILGLTWNCINFKSSEIVIRQQLQREQVKGSRYYLAPLKNNKSRIIVAPPSVLQILQAQKRKQAESRLVAGQFWDESANVYSDSSFTTWNTRQLVFTGELGQHLSHTTVYSHFKKIVTDLGIPSARFHDLRHSYAVAAIQSGDDIKTVQGNLGHATAAFTLDVYGHVTDKMRRDSANRMEQYMKSVKSE